MKQKSLFLSAKLFSSIFLIGCLLVFIISCQKQADVAADDPADKQWAAQILSSHLNKLKQSGSDEGKRQVDKLLAGIDFSNLWVERTGDGNQMIAAPLTADFETLSKLTDKNFKYIAMLVNPAGEVVMRNVFVHVPGAGNTNLPDQFFTNVFENKRFSLDDGDLIALSPGGTYKYDLEFENGKLKTRSTLLKKEAVNKTGTATESDGGLSAYCIDWYRVRIYYDAYGNIIDRYEEHLGQTCYGCGQVGPLGQTETCDYIDDGAGVGGGEPEGYDASREYSWQVASSGGFFTTSWSINSLLRLKGRRVASHPNGGYFKEAKSLGVSCSGCSTNGIT